MGYRYGVRYRPMRHFPRMTTTEYIGVSPLRGRDIMGAVLRRQPIKAQ